MTVRLPERPFAHQGGVVILAHRGWRGYYPENTMLAFAKAAEMPIDGLEIDIHCTKDGVPVVFHDPTLERTTNGSGRIQDLTLAELKQLDAGYNFSKDSGQTFPFRGQGITVPTLAEVFERFPDLWINVDIKQQVPNMIRPFTDLIQQYNMTDRMCVGSFHTQTVRDFRLACPVVARSGSVGETLSLFAFSKVGLGQFYRGRAHVLQIPPRHNLGFNIVSQRFVQTAHERNTAVHLWTINETTAMQQFIDMGVDGLITDYPDRALKLLGRI
jgi:glycerophosphoryl diester phosphodiesterase